jgi:hypothetical protein
MRNSPAKRARKGERAKRHVSAEILNLRSAWIEINDRSQEVKNFDARKGIGPSDCRMLWHGRNSQVAARFE